MSVPNVPRGACTEDTQAHLVGQLVWQEELALMELMQQEHLNPLGSLSLQYPKGQDLRGDIARYHPRKKQPSGIAMPLKESILQSCW